MENPYIPGLIHTSLYTDCAQPMIFYRLGKSGWQTKQKLQEIDYLGRRSHLGIGLSRWAGQEGEALDKYSPFYAHMAAFNVGGGTWPSSLYHRYTESAFVQKRWLCRSLVTVMVRC